MLFNSYIFILLFLPICLCGYFLLNKLPGKVWGQLFLLGMSLWFYGYNHPTYIILIAISVMLNYIYYQLLMKNFAEPVRKFILVIALLSNIGILFYFKYFNFFMENVQKIVHGNFESMDILLPLGISFFTFQQISFVVDSYKRDVPKYGLIFYASFVTYFPQLIAGPIVTHEEMIPQFTDESRKKFQWENFSRGFYLFVLGLAKKVLIADNFGNAVNTGYGMIDQLNQLSAIFVMLSYTIQIYFDFSGYCDMATGIAKMMNIDLVQNFNSPYQATTILEFWDRWHMTLTRFLTKYIYIPLGGSRKGTLRTYINVFLVFLISGLWHGANWTFIVWGMMHGIFSILTRMGKGMIKHVPKAVNWLITFLFVNVAWIFFRADSLEDAGMLVKKVFTINPGGLHQEILDCFTLTEFRFVIYALHISKLVSIFPYFYVSIALIFAMLLLLKKNNSYEMMQKFTPNFFRMVLIPFLLVWSIFCFEGVSTFLYFNF